MLTLLSMPKAIGCEEYQSEMVVSRMRQLALRDLGPAFHRGLAGYGMLLTNVPQERQFFHLIRQVLEEARGPLDSGVVANSDAGIVLQTPDDGVVGACVLTVDAEDGGCEVELISVKKEWKGLGVMEMMLDCVGQVVKAAVQEDLVSAMERVEIRCVADQDMDEAMARGGYARKYTLEMSNQAIYNRIEFIE